MMFVFTVGSPFRLRVSQYFFHAPFPHPAHRTGRADFPHPALRLVSSHRPRKLQHNEKRDFLAGSVFTMRQSSFRDRRTFKGIDEAIGQYPCSWSLPERPEVRSLSSTGITRRQRYYEPVRHPKRPDLSLAGVRLEVAAIHRWGFPCCLSSPLSCMPSPLPRWDRSDGVAHLVRPTAAFPVIQAGQLPHCPFRGLLDVHSHYGLHAR